MITAHGISNAERTRLLARGLDLVDATCPLVKKAHAAALRLARDGCFVIVIGKPAHVEVRGLTGDLPPNAFQVIDTLHAVRSWPARNIGILGQTTTPEHEALPIVQRIRDLNPRARVRFINTICQPTRDRQAALETLLRQVTVLVVVGGRHSNNTRQLASRAKDAGIRAIHVESAPELLPEMFAPTDIVGLTAGTSTLPETIAAVKERLLAIHHEESSPSPHTAAHP
jgi:4-hydroxy-3-methylbut-2-enyl diphosphate reductase